MYHEEKRSSGFVEETVAMGRGRGRKVQRVHMFDQGKMKLETETTAADTKPKASIVP